MGFQRTTLVFLAVGVFQFFAVVTGGKLPSQPTANFKFNCGSDMCTFPVQYCDPDSDSCQYCQDDRCATLKFPDQCKAYCSDYLGKNTPTPAASVSNGTSAVSGSMGKNDQTNILLWIIIVILLVFLLVILALFGWFYKHQKKTQRLGYIKAQNEDTEKGDPGLVQKGRITTCACQSEEYPTIESCEGKDGNTNRDMVNINLLKDDSSEYSTTSTPDQFEYQSLSNTANGRRGENSNIRKPVVCAPHTEGDHNQHENFGETQIMNKNALVNVQERSRNNNDSGFTEVLYPTTINRRKQVNPEEYYNYPVSKEKHVNDDECTEMKTITA